MLARFQFMRVRHPCTEEKILMTSTKDEITNPSIVQHLVIILSSSFVYFVLIRHVLLTTLDRSYHFNLSNDAVIFALYDILYLDLDIIMYVF